LHPQSNYGGIKGRPIETEESVIEDEVVKPVSKPKKRIVDSEDEEENENSDAEGETEEQLELEELNMSDDNEDDEVEILQSQIEWSHISNFLYNSSLLARSGYAMEAHQLSTWGR